MGMVATVQPGQGPGKLVPRAFGPGILDPMPPRTPAPLGQGLGPGLVENKRYSPADEITGGQYERGWEMFSTGHNVPQICAATGMTKPTLNWLTKIGDATRGYVSYQSRIAEQTTALRRRALEAANDLSKATLDSLRREVEIASTAQQLVTALLKAHAMYVVTPGIRTLQGLQPGDDPAEVLAGMALPSPIRETLRVLGPMIRLETTARTFRTVFDAPGVAQDPLSGTSVTRLDLSAEQALPASFSLVEELRGEGGGVADPLDLMSDFAGMTAEELTEWGLGSGSLPDRMYGDPVTVQGPEGAPDPGPLDPPDLDPGNPGQPAPR